MITRVGASTDIFLVSGAGKWRGRGMVLWQGVFWSFEVVWPENGDALIWRIYSTSINTVHLYRTVLLSSR